ncbi:MAG: hypothetical protein U1F46_01955 [Marinagarivorans sp.]
MNMLFKLSLIFLLAALCACESKTPAPTGVIPAAQTQALKDAKNVEKQLMEVDQARRKQLDESTN